MRTLISVWQTWVAWLGNTPHADPVDRANAVVLQILFAALLASVPPLWFYRLALTDIPLRPGEGVSIAFSAGIVVLAAVGFWLIRRGHFQRVLRVFLIVVAVALMASHLSQGAEANRYEAPLQLAWLVMAGLMVGRKALWALYAWLGLAVVLGTWVDVSSRQLDWVERGVDALVSLMIYLFVTLLVDRAATAFRRALADALAREQQVIVAGQRLREEMQERERVHRQLIQSQKMEVAGRLAAGLAHDFNHLLSLILAYRAHASASTDKAGLEQALSGIDAAARRATAVSQRLLSFSGRGEGRKEVFDVNPALEQMQPMLRQMFNAEVQLGFSDSPMPLPVYMDRGEFELIVLNIAANSRAAMPHGGRFDIITGHRGEGSDATVLVSLRDTGQGMDEATRQRALEPFFSGREGGTGLGLAVASDVLIAAGGALWLESAPENGTTVRLELPFHVSSAVTSGS